MKQVFRLTENVLDTIIKQTINRILRENQEKELDWKSYDNAADEADERNELGRRDTLRNYANTMRKKQFSKHMTTAKQNRNSKDYIDRLLKAQEADKNDEQRDWERHSKGETKYENGIWN